MSQTPQIEKVEAPITAMCDICGTTETDTRTNLKSSGWELGSGYELCGDHD